MILNFVAYSIRKLSNMKSIKIVVLNKRLCYTFAYLEIEEQSR